MYQIIKSWVRTHPYCLLLAYWGFYLIYFFLLERLVVPRYILHSSIDDQIPFMEAFIIPYALWFPMLAISQAYFLFTSKKEFQNLCFFMFTGMTISLLIYTILPNGLELRVDHYSDNFLGNIVQALQEFDSPTNVCPSIHVASTLAINIVVLKYHDFRHPLLVKGTTTLISIGIILSTMFLKQHSIIDVAAGLALTAALYPITYHVNWRKLFARTPLRSIVD